MSLFFLFFSFLHLFYPLNLTFSLLHKQILFHSFQKCQLIFFENFFFLFFFTFVLALKSYIFSVTYKQIPFHSFLNLFREPSSFLLSFVAHFLILDLQSHLVVEGHNICFRLPLLGSHL